MDDLRRPVPPGYVRTYYMYCRTIPIGIERLVFRADGSAGWNRTCCGCVVLALPSGVVMKVSKQRLLHWRLLLDAFASFILAFLVHLIPSHILGLAWVLGSPQNHALLGIPWFGGWPVCFILTVLLRPWGLSLTHSVDGSSCGWVPFASRGHAVRVAAAHAECAVARQSGEREAGGGWLPAAPAWNGGFVTGMLVLLGLIAHAVVCGVLIVDCVGRGCCRDDAATLESCVATGYPTNATLALGATS